MTPTDFNKIFRATSRGNTSPRDAVCQILLNRGGDVLKCGTSFSFLYFIAVVLRNDIDMKICNLVTKCMYAGQQFCIGR